MYALVSGEASIAVCVRGDSVSVFRVDTDIEEVGYGISALSQLLQGAEEVIVLQEPSVATIRRSLTTEWALDRAVRLILIALDPEETEQDVAETAGCLEGLLSQELLNPLLERLCNAVLPSYSDLLRLLELCIAGGLVSQVVTELGRLQPRIRDVATAWDALPISLFGDIDEKSDFKRAAAAKRVFAQFARAQELGKENETILEAYRLLAPQKNYRSVIGAWGSSIGLVPTRRTRDNAWRGDYDDALEETTDDDFRTSHEQFVNIMQQQDAISELLRRGEASRARDYAAQLVGMQIARNDQKRAAKSLCRLAQLAKSRGLHSLSLEWNERATNIAPEDGWAHVQSANAYLYYGRLDDAQREFNIAGTLGERFVADTGHIRIMRARAQYDEALQAVSKAKRDYADEDEAFLLWHQQAEILREMWRVDEALSVYEDAVKRFFGQRSLYCGKAAVLVQLGRPSQAIDVYTACLDILGADVVALSGRAQAMFQMGRIDEAIVQYKKAIERFPDEPVPRCGLAEVLHLRGDQDEALKAYDETRTKFPFIAVAYSGFAEVLKDKGDYDRALKEYDSAIQRFPYETHLANGRVSVLKLMGRFEEALAAADETTSKFPFDLMSATGRAVLLRALSRLDEAIEVYDNIVARWPGFLAARHGKASILAVQKHYDEALALLQLEESPNSVDGWVGHHLRGMILLRTGRTNEAKRLFEDAVSRVPYYESRQYFRNTLATIKLRRGDYGGALAEVEQTSYRTISNILVLHALLRLNRRPEAIRTYNWLTDRPLTPVVRELNDELAGQLGLTGVRTQHDDEWLFEHECEAILLAA